MEQASATLFPLDLLLEALRLQGMPVAADLQLRLARYLNRQGGRVLSAEQWKHRLSALLSHDAEQQAQLQRLFDQLWEGWQAATAAGESAAVGPASGRAAGTTDREQTTSTEFATQAEAWQSAPTSGRSGPIYWPLQLAHPELQPWQSQLFERMMPAWREKELTTVADWDIRASIRATVRAAGRPVLLQRPRLKTPQYLVLIEEWTPQDQLAALYSDLCESLRAQDLTVEWYYYDNNPARLWRDRREPSSYTYIERLMSDYEGFKLLIIGEPEGLMSLTSLGPAAWLTEAADIFSDIAFLNTRPSGSWGWAEQILARSVLMVPATPQGLAALPASWAKGEKPDSHRWRLQFPEPSLPAMDANRAEDEQQLLADIRVYLGKSAYYWLCATAVYPELSYHLTLSLRAAEVRFTDPLEQQAHWLQSLLRLSRLEWFRRGRIPDLFRTWLRDEIAGLPGKAQVWGELLRVLEQQPAPPANSYAYVDREFARLWYAHELAMHTTDASRDKERLMEGFRRQTQALAATDVYDLLGRSYLADLHRPRGSRQDELFRVLWVDDTPEKHLGLRTRLEQQLPIHFELALSTRAAIEALERTTFNLLLTDFSRQGDEGDAFTLLELVQSRRLQARLRRPGGRARKAGSSVDRPLPIAVFTSRRIRRTQEDRLLDAGALAVFDEGVALMRWVEAQVKAGEESLEDRPGSGVKK